MYIACVGRGTSYLAAAMSSPLVALLLVFIGQTILSVLAFLWVILSLSLRSMWLQSLLGFGTRCKCRGANTCSDVQ